MAELTTLARPYSLAAFHVASEDGRLEEWAQSLISADAITNNETIQNLLNSPALTAAQKCESLIGVLGNKVEPKFKNFLNTLADNKRLMLLPTINQQFIALKAQKEKSIEVDVTTAFEISASVQQDLIAALTKNLDREVTLSTTIDSSLLGGALIRTGDTVIDGSVRGHLAKLAEAMNS